MSGTKTPSNYLGKWLCGVCAPESSHLGPGRLLFWTLAAPLEHR
jgi:hypothetical protein